MKIRLSVAAAAFLGLAACGSGGNGDGDGDAAAGKSGSSIPGAGEIRLDPGQWEIEHEILSMEAPGMPKEAMASVTNQKTVIKSCITPEQAAKPNADFFAAKDNGCSYKDFNMAGGRIRGTLSCASEDRPGSMTMTMDGKYSAQSYEMAVEMKTDAGAGGMTIKSRGSGKRIGDCPAS
ncbi:DUF3617 domain-containing protein [Sphingosinicella rhizophila]|uniref:DUF3617 domain-containing protein n=1 Tax=Sphingosinicella rhizophila TaxID=3050082 RepID=A0ABU3Q729_9SPHN|nr:DUF3617 domain-containing protein [Sphingosinicella sp. GR2756]MDT9599204.1 DUF3617 domain-containing protein [Sphingosinicella sp. GR2756]